MIRCNPQGDYPKIHASAFISQSAEVIGKVQIGKNVFVGPCAVVRADETGSSVRIADGGNIQDRVIIHALGGSSVVIGKNTSLSHGCIVHGPCTIGRECFVGFGAAVFRTHIQNSVFVKSLAVIEGVHIPDKKFIPSGSVVESSATVGSLRSISSKEINFSKRVVKANLKLVKGYKKGGLKNV